MIDISENLQTLVEAESQHVIPRVTGRFADNRFIDNLVWSSSGEFYEDQIKRKEPVLYWPFDEAGYSSSEIADLSNNAISGTLTGVTTGAFDVQTSVGRKQRYYDALTDNFTRADSAYSLGFMSGNENFSYTIVDCAQGVGGENNGQTQWGISGNAAVVSSSIQSSTGSDHMAIVNTGATDGEISFTYGAAPDTLQGLVFRFIDQNNFVSTRDLGGFGFGLYETIDGVETVVDVDATTFANTDTLTVVLNHNRVEVQKNGVAIIIYYSTNQDFQNLGTSHGMFFHGDGIGFAGKWDNLSIDTYNPTNSALLLTTPGPSTVSITDTEDMEKISFPGDQTIMMAINPVSLSGIINILAIKTVDSLHNSWAISRVLGTVVGTFYDTSNTGYGITSISTTADDVGTWTYIALRKSGTEVSLWINGVMEGSIVMETDVNDSTDGELTLGDYPTGGLQWGGWIDEFSIFDRALSDEEIKLLYACQINEGEFEGAGKQFVGEQALNGNPEESFAWSVTDSKDEWGNYNNFSGEFKIPPASGTTTFDFGWWSRGQSDSYGNFAHTEKVSYEFDSRKATKLIVSTAYRQGRVKTFSYEIFKEDGSSIYGTATFPLYEDSDDFRNDCLVEISFGTEDIVGFSLEMLSTHFSNDHGRIHEGNLVYDLDLSEDVQSFSFSKIRENNESTLPIGLTSANTASLVLENTDRIYNKYNANSDLSPYIGPDNEFSFELGWIDPDDGSVEYVKIGEGMFADPWQNESVGMVATISSLRDWSKYIQETTDNFGAVFENVSAGRAITEIMKAQGFPARKINYYDSYLRTIIQERPWAFWALSEASGTDIIDAGGRYNGTWSGTGLTVGQSPVLPQEIDPYVYIDSRVDTTSSGLLDKDQRYSAEMSSAGTNRGDISTVAGTELAFSQGFAVSVTIRAGDLPTSIADYMVLFSKLDTAALTWNYAITLKKISAYIYIFEGYVDTSDGSFVVQSAEFSNTQLANTEFHHLILTRDQDVLKLQVDGVVTSEDITGDNLTSTDDATIGGTSVNVSASKHIYDGNISNIAVWNHALSEDVMDNHWKAANLNAQYIFSYLFYKDSTPWDAMLEFATADVGVFYFDEDGFFNYEYSNTFHEPIFDRHTNAQWDLSDDTNIINASHSVDIQSNRVIVVVNPQITVTSNTQNIWSAEDGESLAVTDLTAFMNASQLTASVTDTEDPLWLQTGYFKIDDEIIQYTGKTATSLTGLVRGRFGTTPAEHADNSLVRETRHYEIQFSSAPAVHVKYPFLTSVIFDKNADVDKFSTDAYKADVIISANETTVEGDLVVLQGTNPLTEIDNFFAIAGIPVEEKSGDKQAVKEIRDISSNIRRYRPKELTIDNKFIQDKDYADKIAEFLVRYFGAPVQVIEVEVTGLPHLQLGDLVRITNLDQLNIVDEMFWITESSFDYNGGINQKLSLRAFTEGI